MNLEPLRALNLRINEALDRLPSANPLTLSQSTHGSGEDSRIRQTIDHLCRGLDDITSKRINDEYFGVGPIEPLLADPLVTEIVLNGRDSIWFERNGQLIRLEDEFFSEINYRNFVGRLSRESGLQASLDCPYADGRWRGCRVHLIIPPASGDSAVLTLRRHPHSPWTLPALLERNWASPQGLRALESLVHERRNFLIIGCTGSGKTSVLNACLGTIENHERAVIIEDTDELRAPNPASSKLLTRHDPSGSLREIDQSQLVRQALRMRPDRIILGEIRGGEAKDLLMAFATGHSGCMGTLHAESARQALLRLEMLVQLGAPQWNLSAVRQLIWLSLHSIVVVGRTEDGSRRLEGIYRIAALEEIGFLIEKTA